MLSDRAVAVVEEEFGITVRLPLARIPGDFRHDLRSLNQKPIAYRL